MAVGDWLCDSSWGVWLKEGNIGGRPHWRLLPSGGASVSRWRSMEVFGGHFGEGGVTALTSG